MPHLCADEVRVFLMALPMVGMAIPALKTLFSKLLKKAVY